MYKFWNRHMIPWCFHVVDRDFSSSSSSFGKQEPQALAAAAVAVKKRKTKTKTKKKKKKSSNKKSKSIIKVIKSDGIVKIYRRHIHVSELMLESPKHMVCRSDSFYIGQKIPAMSEKEKLQMGHKYFLLPVHCFQSVLSLVNIASTFSSSNTNRPPNANVVSSSFIISKAAAAALPPNCQAFDIQKTASGYLNIRVSDDFIARLIHMEEEEEDEDDEDRSSRSRTGRLCSTDELEKEYTQLVGCRRGNYKPKLETIRENHTSKTKKNKNKKKKKKYHHPKLSSFFVIKKIRKKRNKNKLSSTSTSTSNSAQKTAASSSDSCPLPRPPPPPPKSKKMKFMRSSSKKL